MSLKRICLMVALMGMLSGCASSLSKSIQQRIAISEQCRLATSVLPDRFEIPETLTSVQIGNVGRCSLDPTQTLLPVCAIDQIVSKHHLIRQPSGNISGESDEQKKSREEVERRWKALEQAVSTLRSDFKELATDIAKIDKQFKELNDLNRAAAIEKRNKEKRARKDQSAEADTSVPLISRYDAQTNWLLALSDNSGSVALKLQIVRNRQYELKRAVDALTTSLEPAARIELEAWDTNLRIHLNRFEEALSGSEALAVREGVKDMVLTHVARRTLEMLHNSLKTADAVLRQLDEKAYGAVSVGYLAFGPDLQKAVNAAFANLQANYAIREKQQQKDAADEEKRRQAAFTAKAPDVAAVATSQSTEKTQLTQPVLRELRRAACENLVQGSQFSMLTELMDTMIILHVEKQESILAEVERSTVPIEDKSVNATRVPDAQSNNPGDIPPFTTYASATSFAALVSGQQDKISDELQPAVTPAGVHMANAWAARQQLLTQAIGAKWQAGGSGAWGPGKSLSGAEAVDENDVQRLADVATAKVIDDAVRLSPAAATMRGAEVSKHISSNVSVVTAATAVSQASVTLKLNLSVSNVNNFTPTNYNNVTPVINLAVPAPTSSPGTDPSTAAPSLCADPSLARAGADCTRTADGYVITFARSFRGDSCLASELEPALTALGRGLAAYRARHGLEHMATVEGYASVLPATLAGCKAAAIAPESACTYSNKLRKDYTMAGCEGPSADRNVVLSAARAKHAARVLETAARGALVVDTLLAKGTQTAQADGPAARDQTILVRLFPRKVN